MGGYKTAASANATYSAARKKLLSGMPAPAAGAGSDSAVPTPSTPKSTGKKRGATLTPADGINKKRGRKSKAEMHAVATTEADPDDDEAKDEPIIKGEGDAEDDAAVVKVLDGGQELLDGGADTKVESAEDA